MKFSSIALIWCLTILMIPCYLHAQTAELSGIVTDAKTGETLTGVVLVLEGTSFHATTDLNGHFLLKATAGSYTLVIRYTGYTRVSKPIEMKGLQQLPVKLEASPAQLKEVVVKAKVGDNGFTSANGVQSGIIQLSAPQIKNLPSLAGEQDVIKAMQLMPGVKKGTDGGSSILVRGGNNDQNLFILDEAVIYNPAHALTLFSVFNTDALQEAKLIKGPFLAQYQGRLSSVMELKTREGDLKKNHLEGTISSLSARLSVDGPLWKDQVAYQLSARRSYLDQTLKLTGLHIPYHFTDVNGKITWLAGAKDKLTLSGYGGNDVLLSNHWNTSQNKDLITSSETRFKNRAMSLQWHHSNDKLTQTISLVHSAYSYNIGGAFSGNTIKALSGIEDVGLKARWNLNVHKHTLLQWGFSVSNHHFLQTQLITNGELIPSDTSIVPASKTMEGAAYVSAIWHINSRWQINPGFTLSASGNRNKIYVKPEPRIMISYMTNEHNTWKAGYSRMTQYLHMISSSSFALPTDIWYPAGDVLKPATSDLVTFGWFGSNSKWNYSAEAYYKKMLHVCEFAEGKGLQLQIPSPKEISQGKAHSWGTEWMVQTQRKKWSGWIAYTLSWSTRQFDSVNNGKTYYARYDRRHDLSASYSYKWNKNWNLSAIWVLSTGSRFTPQTGSYYVLKPGGIQQVPVYGSTNSARFQPSHRLDLNISYKKVSHSGRISEWQIGAYNTYNRAQPYKISVVTNVNGSYTYKQNGLLGFTPYISYHFTI